MIDEYFKTWASLPAGCPFHMSPVGLGIFFKTRKCHFYGYHPVIGTVTEQRLYVNQSEILKVSSSVKVTDPCSTYQVSRKIEVGKEKLPKASKQSRRHWVTTLLACYCELVVASYYTTPAPNARFLSFLPFCRTLQLARQTHSGGSLGFFFLDTHAHFQEKTNFKAQKSILAGKHH